MFDKDADAEARPESAEKIAVTPAEGEAVVAESATIRTIRYLDDTTFRKCLEEVVTTHSRLLSKLAE